MVRSSHKTCSGDLLVRLVGLRRPHVAYLSLRDHSDEVRAQIWPKHDACVCSEKNIQFCLWSDATVVRAAT